MHLARAPSISILVYCPIELSPADLIHLSVTCHHRAGTHTKSNDIKDFDGLVDSRRRKTTAVLTDAHALDFTVVCSKLLHRFDAHSNFLPELDHSINRAGEEEFGERGHGDKRQLLFVHQRLGIARRRRQGGDVKLLIWQHSSLLLGRRRGHGGRKIVVF